MIKPIDPNYGSHLPILIKALSITDGMVLEFGTGIFSTTFLHWACCLDKRKLISYENGVSYYESYKDFNNDYHQVVLVKDWDEIILPEHCSVALVDHNSTHRRKEEVRRLANIADYIVIHDSNPEVDRHFRFSKVYPLFKYRKDFTYSTTNTSVLSNFKDLTNL